MNVNVGDVLVMKKNHPCGCNRFLVLRTGMDFKIRWENCGHEVMAPAFRPAKQLLFSQLLPCGKNHNVCKTDGPLRFL